jgi:hypothetical protein
MDRLARTGDTVLVKSREIGSEHFRGGWGEKGKYDRKQNTLTPLSPSLLSAHLNFEKTLVKWLKCFYLLFLIKFNISHFSFIILIIRPAAEDVRDIPTHLGVDSAILARQVHSNKSLICVQKIIISN